MHETLLCQSLVKKQRVPAFLSEYHSKTKVFLNLGENRKDSELAGEFSHSPSNHVAMQISYFQCGPGPYHKPFL